MILPIKWCIMLLFSLLSLAHAEPWQKAPEPIHSLLQKKRPPFAYVGVNKKWIYEYQRPNMPTMKDLQAPIERLAGMKIDPNTNGKSRAYYYTGINRFDLWQSQLGMIATCHVVKR